MESVNRIIKNSGILYVKMGITMFISLYTTRLILNSLGVVDFGVFNVIGGAITMLTFLNAAMASATQRFMSYSEGEGKIQKQKSIFNVSIILHFIIALSVGVILEIAGLFFFQGVLSIPENRIFAAKAIYQFMIVSTIFTIMTVPYDAVVNAHENMLYFTVVGIIESILKLLVAFFITFTLFDKLIIYGLLMASISLFIMIIMRVYCHRKYCECEIDPKQYFDKVLFKEMTGFAGWSFMGSATSMLGNYGLGIVLNHFFGAILNAAQGIAAQLNGQLSVFSGTMMKALNPAIVKKEGSGERQDMLKLTLVGIKFSFFIFSFFAIPLLIESPYILKVWLKTVPEWTVIFCRFIIVKTLIEHLFWPLNIAIGAQGNIKKINIYKSILNIIPLPLIYLFFSLGSPPYMMYVISIIIWGFIEGSILIYFTIKNCNMSFIDYLNYVLYKCLIVFILPLLIGLIPVFMMHESFVRLIIVLLFSIIAFITILYFGALTKEEKKYIVEALNNISTKLKYNN